MPWAIEEVDTVAVGSVSSYIALDSFGQPHVCYEDGAGTIRHAWKEDGAWAHETAATPGIVSTDPWWLKGYFSFALGGDVLHLFWLHGGYDADWGQPTTYPATPTQYPPITIHHAYSTLGSGVWSEETIWTGPADTRAGAWSNPFGWWLWQWSYNAGSQSHGFGCAADSSGNGHIIFAYQFTADLRGGGGSNSSDVIYLDGSNGWAETVVMHQVYHIGADMVTATRCLFCDANDVIHALWYVQHPTTYGIEYGQSPGWDVNTLVSVGYSDNPSPWFQPIAVSADSASQGYAFYIHDISDYAAYVTRVGDVPAAIGQAAIGGLALTPDVPHIAFNAPDAPITYGKAVADAWTSETIAVGVSSGLVDLAQRDVPHVTWSVSGTKVMYATLALNAYYWSMF